jgi:hypothetical protein
LEQLSFELDLLLLLLAMAKGRGVNACPTHSARPTTTHLQAE